MQINKLTSGIVTEVELDVESRPTFIGSKRNRGTDQFNGNVADREIARCAFELVYKPSPMIKISRTFFIASRFLVNNMMGCIILRKGDS